MTIAFPLDASELTKTVGRMLSPYRVDGNGWTDLHYAAALNLSAPARSLLRQGAPAEAPLKADGEPLSGVPAQVLRRCGPRFHTLERAGDRPLHLATRADATATVRALIDFGADARAKMANAWSALHVAARFNAVQAAQVLAAHGASVTERDAHGRTPLHAAVRGGGYEVAELLLRHGAPVNARDAGGMTPLHVAVLGAAPARGDWSRLAQLLLDYGADASAVASDDLGCARRGRLRRGPSSRRQPR